MSRGWATSRVIRALVPFAVYTLLGAAATVLGTWAMAVWGPVEMHRFAKSASPKTKDWPMPLPSSLRKEIEAIPNITPGLTENEDAWLEWRGLRPMLTFETGATWCSTSICAVSNGAISSLIVRDKVAVSLDAFRTGWPCRAMAHAKLSANGRRDFDDPLIEGLPVPKLLNRPERRLPLTPLWPGFAINTLMYAAAAWGVWQLPLALRRRRRRKTNKCVNCGYDRKGLKPDAACPECGAFLS